MGVVEELNGMVIVVVKDCVGWVSEREAEASRRRRQSVLDQLELVPILSRVKKGLVLDYWSDEGKDVVQG